MPKISLPTPYRKVIFQIGLVLLIYQCSRLFFFLINQVCFAQVDLWHYLYILFSSLRFDASAVFTLNLPYIVFMLLPFAFVQHKTYQKAIHIWFLISNTFGFIFDIADIAYFPFVRKRMTAEVFHLIGKKSDFVDLLPSYLTKFWYVSVLIVLCTILFIYVSHKINQRYKMLESPKLNIKSIIAFCISLLLSILCIRGGLQLKPLITGNAILVVSNDEIPLLVNTPFSIIHSFEEKKLVPIPDYSDQTVNELFHPIKNYHHHQKPNTCNVVLILLESFGKGYTGIGGRKSYTPFLDSLMQKSYVYTNAFANAYRSADGIPACVAGIPHFMDEPFATSPYSTNTIDALPALLKNLNYQSTFFHGGTNGTMNFDVFAKSAGFDDYKGRKEFNNEKEYDGTWGIWDEPFLQFTVSEMGNMKQPFFSTIFTLSSHEPFALPAKYKHADFANLKGIEKGISYSDMALQQFFASAAKTNWYKNTLFVITADHNFIANNDTYYANTMGLYAIPVLFFKPGDPALVGRNSTLFQQIDILPTILDYIHYPKDFFAFGKSAFDTTRIAFAFNKMSEFEQMRLNNFVLAYHDTSTTAMYDFNTDSLQKKNIIVQQDSTFRQLNVYYKAFKQLLYNSIISNKQSASTFQKG